MVAVIDGSGSGSGGGNRRKKKQLCGALATWFPGQDKKERGEREVGERKGGGRARKIQGGKEGGSKGDLFTTKRRGDRWRTRRENRRERSNGERVINHVSGTERDTHIHKR